MAIDPTRVPRFGHGSRVPGWDEAADLEKDPAPIPDPATTPVPEELRTRIEEYMSRYPDRRSAAIPVLHAVQERYGWCSPEGIAQMASINRQYVGPIRIEEVPEVIDAVRRGEEPLPDRQMSRRKSVDPNAAS